MFASSLSSRLVVCMGMGFRDVGLFFKIVFRRVPQCIIVYKHSLWESGILKTLSAPTCTSSVDGQTFLIDVTVTSGFTEMSLYIGREDKNPKP